MLHFELDPRGGVPAYRQIMDQVKYYVASGALHPRDRLPSIRELARYLRVNPATVVKAYGELSHQHVIEQQQGKGAFVIDGAKGPSRTERCVALGKMCRQLAVEARQMGASPEEVQAILQDELRRVQADLPDTPQAGTTP